MKAIVIGGVAAGMSAASKLRRVVPDAQITVYERGGFLSYGACGLPYYVGGFNDDPAKLIARTQAQYTEMGIRTQLFHEVTHVDAAARRVTVKDLDSGKIFEDTYDVLMVATGCNSVSPKIPGADSPFVFYLKSMEDGMLLREITRLKDVARVAVVGGGYIGVEMTEALLHLGKQVTLIEGSTRILSSFEPEFSEIAAQELERNGVKVMVGCRVEEIADGGSERVVRTSQGNVGCDMIVMCVGVVPATDFLRDTGIRMARNGAILVDREMRTSIDNIYAAGDCAVVYHRLMEEDYFIPLGTYANKCGRIAGGNMAGAHEKFVGALGTAAIKVCSLEMGRTGMSEKDAVRLGVNYKTKLVTANDHPAYYPDPVKLTIKLVYEARTRKLLGATVAGARNAVMRADIFAVAIHAGMTTDELGMVDLAYAPPFAGVWDAVHIASNAAK
ncbi:MAG: CoA-disulfide reductase [Clostridia bacterium]|nr:CoA-disulfide reductase [Clostridia bacterium]